MNANDMPAREPQTKMEKLQHFLKYKAENDRIVLKRFVEQDISQDVYQLLIQDSEEGYRIFLKSLNQKEGEGQLDLDFNEK